MNGAAEWILGRAVLLPGALSQARSILSKTQILLTRKNLNAQLGQSLPQDRDCPAGQDALGPPLPRPRGALTF